MGADLSRLAAWGVKMRVFLSDFLERNEPGCEIKCHEGKRHEIINRCQKGKD